MIHVFGVDSVTHKRWNNIKRLITDFEYSFSVIGTYAIKISLDENLDSKYKHVEDSRCKYTAKEIIDILGTEAFLNIINASLIDDIVFYDTDHDFTNFNALIGNIRIFDTLGKSSNYWIGLRIKWREGRNALGLPY